MSKQRECDVWDGVMRRAMAAVPKPSVLLHGTDGGGCATEVVRSAIASYYAAIAQIGGAWVSGEFVGYGEGEVVEVCTGSGGRFVVGEGVFRPVLGMRCEGSAGGKGAVVETGEETTCGRSACGRGIARSVVGRCGKGGSKTEEVVVGKEGVSAGGEFVNRGNTGDEARRVGVVPGPNVERNRKARVDRKARKLRRQQQAAKEDEVPEWRRKFATGDLADSWAARKVRENKLAILKADEQIKRLESGAGKPRLRSKVLTEAEQEAKVRADYEKHMQKTNADIAYWKKRQEAGAVEKAIALEMEIMDGQLSGKYDPFTPRRTIGWAKTVVTNSSAGSSAKKTVWSGSGASGRSATLSKTSKESVVSMEKYLADMELKERQFTDQLDKLKDQVKYSESRIKNAEDKAAFFKLKAMGK